MALMKGEKKVVLLTKISPKLSETKDIYFANVFASDDNWFTEAYIKPVMQKAYDEGYHDILVNTLNGSRYAVCKGVDLQELSKSITIDFRFVNLANSLIDTATPTRLSTDGVLISGVKLDDDNNITFTTSERAEIQYIDVLTKDEFNKIIGYDASKNQILHNNKGTMTWEEDIDGGTWS